MCHTTSHLRLDTTRPIILALHPTKHCLPAATTRSPTLANHWVETYCRTLTLVLATDGYGLRTNSCCSLDCPPLRGHLHRKTLKTLLSPILLTSTMKVNVAHRVYNLAHITPSGSPPCPFYHSFSLMHYTLDTSFLNRIEASLGLWLFHPFSVTFWATKLVTIPYTLVPH